MLAARALIASGPRSRPLFQPAAKSAATAGLRVDVLATYGAGATTPQGPSGLAWVAKNRLNCGQHGRNSVFGRNGDPAKWTTATARFAHELFVSSPSSQGGAPWRALNRSRRGTSSPFQGLKGIVPGR